MKVMTRVKGLLAAAVAAAGLVAFAEPVVEITKAWQANPGSGVVDFTYEVRDLDGASCDLVVRVEAKGCNKTYTFTNENVAAGLTTTNVNYKTKLGMLSPNVSIYASLVKCQMRGVQLWEGGPIWADRNVGADKPEDSGYYFWWGDTVGYKRNTANNGWVSSQDGTTPIEFNLASPLASKTYNLDNSQLQARGWIGEDGCLMPTNDAARVHLGGDWRMPTIDEIKDLATNCTYQLTTRGGVSGVIVSSKIDSSKSIFFPEAGYGLGNAIYNIGTDGHIWSSQSNKDNIRHAWLLSCGPIPGGVNFYWYSNKERNLGLSVRAVKDAK